MDEAAAGVDAGEMTRARQALPGWHVWTVAVLRPPGDRWCARPPGQLRPAAQGNDAAELIEAAREWAARVAEEAAGKATPAALGIDLSLLSWERSGDGDGSLEVAMPRGPWDHGDWVLTRVAGDPDGRVLVFDRNEWECFIGGARNGEFDDATA